MASLNSSRSVLSRLLRFFFFLLYHPLAWSYDLVAWLVSLGRWREWTHSVLPYLHGPLILELGHGPGHLLMAMRKMGLQAIGLDRSRQMGGLARRRLPGAPVVRADSQRLPFASSSFDQIVATFPTEYITAPSTLRAARRCLRQGGELLLLPVAWIKGRDLLSRAAAALFRATGQAGGWTGAFSDIVAAGGFDVDELQIDLGHSQLVVVKARKPAS